MRIAFTIPNTYNYYQIQGSIEIQGSFEVIAEPLWKQSVILKKHQSLGGRLRTLLLFLTHIIITRSEDRLRYKHRQ
ncbi:hypothetical protein NQ318_009890 [Aromia moschata]|uniref:Uncharacterized protein n=1 Tax=Aromia moschata TaxID=1265417 RepID=A0AAV8Y2X4_9CUCU|nr:hypothetical protein NQ318_009890 [Aromia moschata]